MSIDPRLAERRKVVAEDRAQRNIGRLLRFLAVVAVLAGVAWLFFSPWLSVSQVRTSGIRVSDANAILVDSGITAGRPMILIQPGAAEQSLLADPWISDARVHRQWPDEIVVRVVERTPAAWVQTGGGWVRRAVDGHPLPSPSQPDDSLAWARLGVVAEVDAITSPLVLGSVEFFESLPRDLWPESEMYLVGQELWASVAGHQVRLGRPVEMAEKARTLAAMLERELEEGQVIVLIAPTNPALGPSESEETVVDSDETSAEEQP